MGLKTQKLICPLAPKLALSCKLPDSSYISFQSFPACSMADGNVSYFSGENAKQGCGTGRPVLQV